MDKRANYAPSAIYGTNTKHVEQSDMISSSPGIDAVQTEKKSNYMYILQRKRTKLIDLTPKESHKKDNSRKILVNTISGNTCIVKNVDVSIHFTGLWQYMYSEKCRCVNTLYRLV